jgi:hypothetical protein
MFKLFTKHSSPEFKNSSWHRVEIQAEPVLLIDEKVVHLKPVDVVMVPLQAFDVFSIVFYEKFPPLT